MVIFPWPLPLVWHTWQTSMLQLSPADPVRPCMAHKAPELGLIGWQTVPIIHPETFYGLLPLIVGNCIYLYSVTA